MNERQMNVAKLIFMIYELIEKNVFDVEKSIKESTSNIFEIDSINEESSKKIRHWTIHKFNNHHKANQNSVSRERNFSAVHEHQTNRQTQDTFCILQKKYQIEIESLQNSR